MMDGDAEFVQAERILRVESPLGADVLLAERLTLTEGVSRLFEGRLSVRSKVAEIAPADLLGKPVDLSVELGGGRRRAWNAVVAGLRAGPRASRGLRSFELVLRPGLWLLSQRSDWRIWMDMDAVEIAEALCAEHGLPAPDVSGVVEAPPAEHYSVQAGESDLAYLLRRLEADGIWYHFAHDQGDGTGVGGLHRLHLSSHPAGYVEALAGDGDVRFAHGSTDRNHISRFDTAYDYLPGGHATGDWNFETPGHVPGATAPGLHALPGHAGGGGGGPTGLERFEYPVQGGYGTGRRASEGIEDGEVERVARLRMQADEAEHVRVEGASMVRTLAAGHRFTPYDVANPDNVFAPHVVTSVTHEVVDTSYESVANQPDYANRFAALPADVPATPRRATPRPRIDGVQVAIVAGPPGEEIHPDAHGRVKLWFPWDRRAKKDGTDTCWVRVAQSWAGAGWGAQTIPRIGMEVMVTYLDGDPDRPVVTGVVPNARQTVPYDLPANKTKTVLRSQTHKGDGFNELSFEDERGAEEVYLHGQKDHRIEILNDRTKSIGRDQSESVGRDKAISVGQDHTESVGRDVRHVVGQDVSYEVVRNQQEKYGKDHVHYVGNIHKQDIYADHLVSVGRNMEEEVRGRYVLNVNQSITNNTKTHTLMAFDKFVIKGPGGKITIDGSGITLEAPNIRLKGNVTMGGSGGAQVPTLTGAARDALPLCEECLKQKGED